MDTEPKFAFGAADPQVLRGPQQDRIQPFLRALALRVGECVSYGDLRKAMGVGPGFVLHPTKSALAQRGFDERITTEHRAGYTLRLQEDDWLDTHEFERIVGQLSWLGDQALEHVDPEEARRALAELDRVLDLYSLNPALLIDSPAKQGPPAFAGLHVKYEDLHSEAIRARNFCRIVVAFADPGHRRLARSAIRELNQTTEEDRADSDWYLLMAACIAAGHPGRAVSVFEQAVDYYSRHDIQLPVLLTELRQRIMAGDPVLGLERTTNQQTFGRAPVEAAQSLLTVVQQLGITDATSMSLREARMEPLDCIERTEQTLYFSGVLASKWVTEPRVRKEFDDLLGRLNDQDPVGDVRFLIVNPVGQAYKKLHALRRGEIDTNSLSLLSDLINAHSSFKVRVFDALPAFRIIVIDDQVVTFSPYRLSAEAYRMTKGGWAAPQVVLDPTAPWPLAEAFRLFFEETWMAATPLEAIDLTRLEQREQ